jgi:hypothetical protein
MVNQNNLENQIWNSDAVKCKDTKYSYRHPTQTNSADKVLVMATPKVLIIGSMPVTAADNRSDLKALS